MVLLKSKDLSVFAKRMGISHSPLQVIHQAHFSSQRHPRLSDDICADLSKPILFIIMTCARPDSLVHLGRISHNVPFRKLHSTLHVQIRRDEARLLSSILAVLRVTIIYQDRVCLAWIVCSLWKPSIHLSLRPVFDASLLQRCICEAFLSNVRSCAIRCPGHSESHHHVAFCSAMNVKLAPQHPSTSGYT